MLAVTHAVMNAAALETTTQRLEGDDAARLIVAVLTPAFAAVQESG